MTGRVHLLLPGSRSRVKCGAAWQGRDGVIITARVPSAVTCKRCLGRRRDRPDPPTDDQAAQIAEYVAVTTLVGGRRRLIMPCECGALIVAGIDHTCDPADRRARRVPLD
jgi:hypothetical protein